MMVLMVFALTAACSKKLMPPDIEAADGVSESGFEETAQGLDSENGVDSGFGSDQGFAGRQGIGGNDGFPEETAILSEEDLTEMAIPTGPPIITDGVPGNGSSGSFGADNPFASGGPGGLGPNGGVDEARLFSYRSTAELKDVHFQFDRYDLDESSKNVLRENAGFMKQHPDVRIEIQGHCDERGTNNYNLALGQRRANSTKKYLASMGIEETRMHVISYGEEKPFCAASNENCWWRNRRAHFMVAR